MEGAVDAKRGQAPGDDPIGDAENTVYNCNCHCGQYRFQLAGLPLLDKIYRCTCSLCAKLGSLWFISPPGTLNVERGDDGCMTEHQSSVLLHKFCRECGVCILGRHTTDSWAGQWAVNIRTIMEVNVFKMEQPISLVTTEEENGRCTGDAVQTEPVQETEAASDVQQTVSCHCGRIRVELLVPLSELEVREDNCSICVRRAGVGIYPTKAQVRVYVREHTYDYKWNRKWSGPPFCATCGVHVFANIYGPPQEFLDKIPEERREMAL